MNRMTRVTYLSSYLEWVSHQDFKNVAYVGFFRHFLCVFVFVVVFVIVFVFVFVSSYYFWIAFIISFQNMYGYRGLWSLRAEIMIIFEVMTDGHTHSNSTYRLGPSGRMGPVKIMCISDYQKVLSCKHISYNLLLMWFWCQLNLLRLRGGSWMDSLNQRVLQALQDLAFIVFVTLP